LDLREKFIILFFFHLIFVITDFIIYDIEVLAIIMDFCLVWADYNNYMLLNKLIITGEIVVISIYTIAAISHIQRVLA